MKKTIICRYGEIYLKGNNKYFFESVLVKNIRASLKEFSCKFEKMQNRLVITDFAECDEELIT